MSSPHALYLCYFGIREPLVQTQVLPYLREIRKAGVVVSILTFESQTEGDWQEPLRAELEEEGIGWHWLKYHKRFSVLATAYDIFRGVIFVRAFIRATKPAVLHGRIHVPTLIAAIARKFSSHKPKLLFDIRGFFPEEYTDAGVWPVNGWLYRTAKRVERWLLDEADAFVVLTEKARKIMFDGSRESGFDSRGRPVEVIPCCVDLEKFNAASDDARRAMRAELGVGERRVIAYIGSFGGWYLTEEMINFFVTARSTHPDTFVLILTQRDKNRVRDALLGREFNDRDFFVASVRPDEIPRYLAAADVAISFIKPCYSKLSSSPTKIAEYLACGVPVISNRGIGDVDDLIEGERVGALLDGFSERSYLRAVESVDSLDGVRQRCREAARNGFDLANVAGERYRRLYRRLLGPDSPSGDEMGSETG